MGREEDCSRSRVSIAAFHGAPTAKAAGLLFARIRARAAKAVELLFARIRARAAKAVEL